MDIETIRGQSLSDQRRPTSLPIDEPADLARASHAGGTAGVTTRSGRIRRPPNRFTPTESNAPILVQRPMGWTERAALASPQIENAPVELEHGISITIISFKLKN